MENYAGMIADIGAVAKPNFMGSCGGFGGGWEALIGLAAIGLIFGGGGFGGFGGNGGFQQGFNTQNILSKLDGITNGLCDGFYSVATNSLQAQNQLQRDLCTGFAAVNAGINENRYAAKDCCCQTQRAIDSVKFENAQNTCAIVNAIHKESDDTRKLITQNLMDSMREQIQDQKFQLSQYAQNSYLLNKLQPAPVPSYQVANPNCCHNVCGCNGYQQ